MFPNPFDELADAQRRQALYMSQAANDAAASEVKRDSRKVKSSVPKQEHFSWFTRLFTHHSTPTGRHLFQ